MKEDRCVPGPQPSPLGDVGLDSLSRWLVEASPDGLWVFDSSGRTVLANARLAQMLGRTPEEMQGLSVFETLDEVGPGAVRPPPRRASSPPATRAATSSAACCARTASASGRWSATAPSRTTTASTSGGCTGSPSTASSGSSSTRCSAARRSWPRPSTSPRSAAGSGTSGSDVVTWSDELYRIYGVEPDAGLRPQLPGLPRPDAP